MKFKIRLFEGFSKEEIQDITQNYTSIRDLEFTDELQKLLVVDEEVFDRVITTPEKNTLDYNSLFTKFLKKTGLPNVVKIRIKFILLALATDTYSKLTPNYRYHSIHKEVPYHYILRVNGNDSLLFRPEGRIIHVREIDSHSGRGY